MARELMAPRAPGYVSAKTIPNAVALGAVLAYQVGKGPHPLLGALPDWPAKVVVAKLHKLERRGWTKNGAMTTAGLEALDRSDEETEAEGPEASASSQQGGDA